MEHPAILPGHAHIPACVEHLLDGAAMGGAPMGAVQEEHVGAFGFSHLYPVKMLCDEITGKVDVAAEGFAQFIYPLVAFGPVGADKGVHGENVHIVIMGLAALGRHAVPQIRIIDNVIAAHQTRQVEGLAGGVERHRAVAGVLAHRLGGGVLVAVEQDVGPDLVRDDQTVVGFVDLHGLLNFFPGPHTAAGVMGRAEDGHVDVVLLQFGIHIGVVHPPDTLFIPDQRRMHNAVAVVFQRIGKTDVGGAVQQHPVAGGGKAGQRRNHTAQNAVFIADAVPGQ